MRAFQSNVEARRVADFLFEAPPTARLREFRSSYRFLGRKSVDREIVADTTGIADVARARLEMRTGENFRQMRAVVPLVPFRLDTRLDHGINDQQRARRWAALSGRDLDRLDKRTELPPSVRLCCILGRIWPIRLQWPAGLVAGSRPCKSVRRRL